jgi:hypothetical protein
LLLPGTDHIVATLSNSFAAAVFSVIDPEAQHQVGVRRVLQGVEVVPGLPHLHATRGAVTATLLPWLRPLDRR